MNISLTQLTKQLDQTIAPFYIISGEEILLVDETCERISSALKNRYELIPQRITITTGFDWSSLYNEFSTPSLFNPVSCFILNLFSIKLESTAKDVLTHFAQHSNPQRFIIVKLPKIEKETEKTKWFTALTNACVWISIPSIAPTALPAWLIERAPLYGLRLNLEQAQWIAQRTENNLLASDQALKKIQLINQPITKALLEELIEAQASYTIFLLSDACLAGNGPRVARILETLHAQDVAPLLLLWSLAKDIRAAIEIHTAISKGQPFTQACQQQHIWTSRQAMMQHFIRRSNLKDCLYCLKRLADIDRLSKGLESGDPWHALQKICLTIAQLRPNGILNDGFLAEA